MSPSICVSQAKCMCGGTPCLSSVHLHSQNGLFFLHKMSQYLAQGFQNTSVKQHPVAPRTSARLQWPQASAAAPSAGHSGTGPRRQFAASLFRKIPFPSAPSYIFSKDRFQQDPPILSHPPLRTDVHRPFHCWGFAKAPRRTGAQRLICLQHCGGRQGKCPLSHLTLDNRRKGARCGL